MGSSSTPRPGAPIPGTPAGPGSTGSTLRERFGWYFLGLALGMLFVGLLWQARSRAYSRQQQHFQQQQQQQQQQAPAGASSASPPAAAPPAAAPNPGAPGS